MAKGADELREWRDWLRHALERVGIAYVGLLIDDYDGPLYDAYEDDKVTPAVTRVRLNEVDDPRPRNR